MKKSLVVFCRYSFQYGEKTYTWFVKVSQIMSFVLFQLEVLRIWCIPVTVDNVQQDRRLPTHACFITELLSYLLVMPSKSRFLPETESYPTLCLASVADSTLSEKLFSTAFSTLILS